MYHKKKQVSENCGYVKSVEDIEYDKFELIRILVLEDNEIKETVVYKEYSNHKLWETEYKHNTYNYYEDLSGALTDVSSINENFLNKVVSGNKPYELNLFTPLKS